MVCVVFKVVVIPLVGVLGVDFLAGGLLVDFAQAVGLVGNR